MNMYSRKNYRILGAFHPEDSAAFSSSHRFTFSFHLLPMGKCNSWDSSFLCVCVCVWPFNPMNCSLLSLSLQFSRQEHWSGLPFPPPGDQVEGWNISCILCVGRWILCPCARPSVKYWGKLLSCRVLPATLQEYQGLDGHEWEPALGVGDGQGSLTCCSPEWDRTERLSMQMHTFP